MRAPSELEGAVLGVVWKQGPCTAYAVRKVFLDSPSPQWSGSAGAIYPLVERLVSERLLASRAQAGSRRGGRLYRLTAAGERALRAWLAPPLPEWVVGVPPDPIRTRLEFLGALSAESRRAFIREARAGIEAQIRAIREDCRAARRLRDPLRLLVGRGALAALRARRRWMIEVERAFRRGPLSRIPSG